MIDGKAFGFFSIPANFTMNYLIRYALFRENLVGGILDSWYRPGFVSGAGGEHSHP